MGTYPPQGNIKDVRIPTMAIRTRQGLSPTVIPNTRLGDGSHIAAGMRVAAGTVFETWGLGVETANGQGSDSIFAEVVTTSGTVASTNSRRLVGAPLGSAVGAANITFKVDNRSGTRLDLTGHFHSTLR